MMCEGAERMNTDLRRLQIPSSKPQRNFKLQAPIATRMQGWGPGHCCFSGCFSLRFGALVYPRSSLVKHLPPRQAAAFVGLRLAEGGCRSDVTRWFAVAVALFVSHSALAHDPFQGTA